MEHLRITVAGKAYDVTVEKIGGDEPAHPASTHPAPVTRSAAPARAAAAPAPAPAAHAPAADGAAVSPLAGIVQAVEVTVGANVNEGDLIITLEAMKMYTAINAQSSGTVSAIHVKVGDAVEEGQALYTIG
jgi:biotin carboxyl carrier protein